MIRLGLLGLLAVWCGPFLCAQIDGTLYTDGKIVLQINGGFDHGTSPGETRFIHVGFNNEHHAATCDPDFNGSNAGLYLLRGNNIIWTSDEICTNVSHHNLTLEIPASAPGGNYRFYFYYDERPTSSCCADFHSVYTDYFVIGEDISIITPEDNSIQPIDLTFEWSTTSNDDYYHFGIAEVDAGMSFSSSTETFNNALYSTTLTASSLQLPDGILADGVSYRVLVYAKQFGKFFSATADFTASIALPAEISYFLAEEPVQGTIQLLWGVASEMNVLRYDIEASEDGGNFEKIGSVSANQAVAYSYNDHFMIRNPLGSVLYYRLGIVDIDGSSMNSRIISKTISPTEENLHLFPNPVNHYLSLRQNIFVGAYQVDIHNTSGSLLATEMIMFSGVEPVEVDVSYLLPGKYLLSIQQDQEVFTMPFIKIE